MGHGGRSREVGCLLESDWSEPGGPGGRAVRVCGRQQRTQVQVDPSRVTSCGRPADWRAKSATFSARAAAARDSSRGHTALQIPLAQLESGRAHLVAVSLCSFGRKAD